MKAHDINHSCLPVGIQNDGMTALEKAHREAALDEALCESFPASDPVAVSFTPPRAPDKVNVPSSKFQIENDRRLENEKYRMAECSVMFEGRGNQDTGYHYRIFSDARDFARLDHANLSYQIEADDPAQRKVSEMPTEAEQRQMAELAITCDGRQVLAISRLSL
jgi:hypothetical protein